MSKTQEDLAGALAIGTGIVTTVIFAGISAKLGTCGNLIYRFFEGIFITAEIGIWLLVFSMIIGAVLLSRMPFIRNYIGTYTKGIIVLLVGIWFATFIFSLVIDAPACATLPSDRFWPWLNGLVPW
ncbi:hypothetical protein GWG54_19390 [Natronococcus sp. JC468]|uniref:hypothetical protein n=1 Tax=Natronococcus sp. JC468 TaxID=1961921 RepID=UPI00143914D5|nr:hypothetical protein [Natronococcus sp. JC468]NKE37919.1 hypothetical protein [Natronococcus sp. JC468]